MHGGAFNLAVADAEKGYHGVMAFCIHHQAIKSGSDPRGKIEVKPESGNAYGNDRRGWWTTKTNMTSATSADLRSKIFGLVVHYVENDRSWLTGWRQKARVNNDVF